MKFGVKPTPRSLRISIARMLLDAVFFLFTASRPASVTASRPRKIARSPHSFHISIRSGKRQMMSVRVCTVKYLRMPARLDLPRQLLASPDVHPEDVVGDEDVGRLDRGELAGRPAPATSRGSVLSWNFQTEQKLHLKGQPRAVSISARGSPEVDVVVGSVAPGSGGGRAGAARRDHVVGRQRAGADALAARCGSPSRGRTRGRAPSRGRRAGGGRVSSPSPTATASIAGSSNHSGRGRRRGRPAPRMPRGGALRRLAPDGWCGSARS